MSDLSDAAAFFGATVATIALGWNIVRDVMEGPRIIIGLVAWHTQYTDGRVDPWQVDVQVANIGNRPITLTWAYLNATSSPLVVARLDKRLGPTDHVAATWTAQEIVEALARAPAGAKVFALDVLDSTGRRRRLMLRPEWDGFPTFMPDDVWQGSWRHRGRRWIRRVLHRPYPSYREGWTPPSFSELDEDPPGPTD